MDWSVESQTLLEAILDSTREGIIGLSLDGAITFANSAAVEILGYTREELLGANSHALYHYKRHDGSPLPVEECPVHSVLSAAMPQEGSDHYIRKDGTFLPVEFSLRPIIGDSGDPVGVVVSFRDIGERERTARDLLVLRAALEQSPVTAVITDTGGTIEYVNPQFERSTGYSAAEALGQNPRILKGGSRPAEDYADLWRTISGGRNWHGLFLNKRKNGEEYLEEAVISPVKDEKGTIIRYLALKQDVTQERFELACQKTIARASTRFISVTEHDFDDAVLALLRDMGELIRADRGYLFLAGPTPRGTRWSNTHEWCAPGVEPQRHNLQNLPPDTCGWWIRKMETGKPLVIPSVADLPAEAATEQAIPGRQGIKSLIAVPLRGESDAITGFLGYDATESEQQWCDTAVRMLGIIGEIISGTMMRNAARATLRRSEQKLWTILENITDVIWSATYPELDTVFVSPSVAHLYGSTPEEVYRNSLVLRDAVHPDDRGIFDSRVEKLNAGERTTLEYRIIRTDGTSRWVLDRSHFVYDHSKDSTTPVRIDGIITDITKRKTAEWHLRERIKEREAMNAIWVAYEKRLPLAEFLQEVASLIPAGFRYPRECCARIRFEDTVVTSTGFRESQQSIHREIALNTKSAGTVTVFYHGALHDETDNPFLPEEEELIGEIAGRLGFMIGADRMRDQLRVQAAAMENAPVSVIICDARAEDLPIIYVNQGFIDLTGYSVDDATGRNPRFLHEGDPGQPGLEEIRRGLAEHRPSNALLRNFRKDGSLFWSELRVAPVLDDGGEISHYVGVSSDVTEVLQVRNELLENERRLRISQEYADVGNWDWNIKTGEIRLSERVALFFGRLPSDTVISFTSFVEAVHPQDRTPIEEAVRQCLASGDQYSVEHRIMRPDGSTLWVHAWGNVSYDETGEPHHLIGLTRDITEEKAKEQEIHGQWQFQELLAVTAARFVGVNSATIGPRIAIALQELGEFFQVDRSQIFLFSSDSTTVERVHEWCSDGTESQAPYFAGFPLDRVPWYRHRILEEKAVAHIPDVETLPPEALPEKMILDSFRIKSNLAVPIFNEKRVFGFLGFNTVERPVKWTDHQVRGLSVLAQILANAFTALETEQALALLRLQSDAARESAEKANRAKNDFLSSMSHELRTPLNAILGFGQILAADETLNEDQLDFTREIVDAGHHLLALVNEVLDLARIESGRIDLTMEAVRCASLIDEVVRLIEPYSEQQGVSVHVRPMPDTIAVTADRVRLKQVLINLLSNAVKYNVSGGSVTIDFEEEGASGEASLVRISITDTGVGIPPDKLGELFTQFNRLGRESGDIEGTGIGLALSKRLIELMGGTIDAESEPGTGSVFRVELPRALDSPSREAPGSMARDAVAAGPASSGGTRIDILYIEDNPASLRLMEHIIGKDSRFNLITAHTGSLGVDLAETYRPAIILVDINLPGMDGYEVLNRIRSSPWGSGVDVVAVTANAMEGSVDHGLSAGFSAYLTKPLDVSQLLQMLNTMADNRKGDC